jgi:Holliday junction resolvasome RuvABC DNA-binding subunit
MKKMFETYPGVAFPEDEKSFVAAAEKLGFAESDIQTALSELSEQVIDDESLDAITGGLSAPRKDRFNVRSTLRF